MASSREASPSALLRRAGVADTARALELIGQIEAVTGVTLDDPAHALSYLADPDAGLLQAPEGRRGGERRGPPRRPRIAS
ncbi:hypothetical protein [Demequina litorisediminis]|uniref:hypothetical protein n=1 Tax=Demequina litorisediminis TaxID=1849022 RepID=UPI0024E07363|nr:hypothetical protein [Demequina litorisediminis]